MTKRKNYVPITFTISRKQLKKIQEVRAKRAKEEEFETRSALLREGIELLYAAEFPQQELL